MSCVAVYCTLDGEMRCERVRTVLGTDGPQYIGRGNTKGDELGIRLERKEIDASVPMKRVCSRTKMGAGPMNVSFPPTQSHQSNTPLRLGPDRCPGNSVRDYYMK